MRLISALTADHSVKSGRNRRRFIGKEPRSAAKPECISPDTERQWARALGSSGSMCAFGKVSFKYSARASVSHTTTSPWTRYGMRIDEDCNNNSARFVGSSGETTFSSNVIPERRASKKPRSDQDE